MSALVVVDAQIDFVSPAGNLSAPGGEAFIPMINELILGRKWDLVVKTRDAHPANHSSFQEQGGRWPVHCVVETPGYEFHPDLASVANEMYIDKGTKRDVDSYSAFGSKVRQPSGEDTGLHGVLKAANIHRVYVCGYVTDFCVHDTIEDSIDLGYETHAVPEACSPFDPGAQETVFQQLKTCGVHIDTIPEVLGKHADTLT